MEIDIVNKENKKVGTTDLPEEVFNVKWNPNLVHQVITSLATNRRAPFAHTKTRGEIRGGGKKPWRQKGTGRARHGSTRSPLWRGGGITFGPRKEKNFEKKINKKMKKKALYSVLSRKFQEGEIIIVDSFGVEEPKTKIIAEMMRAFHGEKKKKVSKTLLVAKEGQKNAVLSGRNIKNHAVTYPSGINVENILQVKKVMFEKQAMEEFIAKETKKDQRE